jgi:hypothetical protein
MHRTEAEREGETQTFRLPPFSRNQTYSDFSLCLIIIID